jgi:hypothetical protein
MHRADPSALYRFKREFRALAGVTHPNLVALHELVATGGGWYFTMELVDGVDFLTHVRGGPDARPEPPGAPGRLSRLRAALRQLAEGLGALHAAGRLHRDVKPSNVLVTREGRVMLLDFGLAAELSRDGDHLSTARHVVGTLTYMAPEQAAGRAVTPASDWYSAGVMLFEALTDQAPCVGDPLDVLAAKQAGPGAPSARAPGCPADLDALCHDLLAPEPTDRPSGPEVLRRLGASAPATGALGPPPVAGIAAPLVGRGPHLRALADALAAVRRGRPVLVAVRGRSGGGKSALVEHFLDALKARDEAVTLAGRCYEQESVPYKALDALIDDLSRYLGRLPLLGAQALLPRDVSSLTRIFPVLRRVDAVAAAPRPAVETADPQELRRKAFAALKELLARLGDRRPLVLAIDDLQWGDPDSAALLCELIEPPDPPALLLLVCYRSEDESTSPVLRRLLSPQGRGGSGPDRRLVSVDELSRAEAEEIDGPGAARAGRAGGPRPRRDDRP